MPHRARLSSDVEEPVNPLMRRIERDGSAAKRGSYGTGADPAFGKRLGHSVVCIDHDQHLLPRLVLSQQPQGGHDSQIIGHSAIHQMDDRMRRIEAALKGRRRNGDRERSTRFQSDRKRQILRPGEPAGREAVVVAIHAVFLDNVGCERKNRPVLKHRPIRDPIRHLRNRALRHEYVAEPQRTTVGASENIVIETLFENIAAIQRSRHQRIEQRADKRCLVIPRKRRAPAAAVPLLESSKRKPFRGRVAGISKLIGIQ